MLIIEDLTPYDMGYCHKGANLDFNVVKFAHYNIFEFEWYSDEKGEKFYYRYEGEYIEHSRERVKNILRDNLQFLNVKGILNLDEEEIVEEAIGLITEMAKERALNHEGPWNK